MLELNCLLFLCITEFSKVQQSFANTMKSFKFEIIGETQTQDEKMISTSLEIEYYPLVNDFFVVRQINFT